MLQDFRFAIRSFLANPGFALAAVLSLAIGIGANTSIFSVTNALLIRPLPYQDADRLTILWNRSPGLGITEDWFSTAQYFDIKNGHRGFEQIAIAIGANYNLTGDGEPERVGTVRVSSGFLPMLGVQAAAGRLFEASEDGAVAAGSAILDHGFWMRRYGGASDVLGKPLVLNGQPFQIIGILPPSFSLPREVMPTLGGAEEAEILLSLPLAANAAEVRSREDYNIVGKLKPGVTIGQAQAEMDAITARLRRDHPDFYPPNGGLTFSIVALRDQIVGDVHRPVLILLGAGGFVLLIACANVANLLLSRALARQKELAVRAALGASRTRLVRQMLTESVLLAVGGGALGVLFSFWSIRGIHWLGSNSVPRLQQITIDGQVLLFTLSLSLVSGIIFGLVPAFRVFRLSLHSPLSDASRGSAGTGAIWERGRNVRRLLVVSELALSVVLLIGAGLLVRSFVRLLQVAPGFNADNVLTLELTMTGRKYNDAQAVLETYRQLWERLDLLPGVTASGGVTALPLSQMMAWGPITAEGRIPLPGEKFINADQRTVAGRYFQTMEIPLLAGRFFDEHDTRTNPRVVIVDQHMAEQLWPNESAIGKRIRTGGIDANANALWMTVVGVVGRIKQDTLDSDSRIALYYPHAQVTSRAMNVVMRGTADAAAVRREIRALDADLPIYKVRMMSERVDESLARRRFAMLLLTLFAGLAVGLATIGVYGVMSYLVSQGTRELGIRIALGATPRGVALLVLRQGMSVAVLGVGIGVAGALALTRFMQSLLFDVASTDALTFAVVSLTLISVALLASYIPARRASLIDPIISLRSE